jgi:Uma2 family endonuclease
MMPARSKMTYAEYVAFEDAFQAEGAVRKHELIDGEIVAMAGGTIEHGALAMAFGRLLGNALGDKPCRVFSSDVRVHVLETGMAAYPDLSVVCGKLERDAEDRHAITNPVLVLEVLSDSTEAKDRGVKAAHYRHLPSLREYVLVSQRERRVEVHRRNEAGRWELFESEGGGRVELASVGCAIAVDELYRDPLAAS